MRNKLILFLMLAFLGSTPFLRADETTFGFETGMPTGWTTIDANNDGYTWCLTSAIPTTWTYYASISLDWYRTGTDAICSGSYINGVGAITPDEYLVTSKATIESGATFSFWAAATDASYPAEHFGVFVSDNGTSGWTSVQEWTLTGKSGGNNGGRASRDGQGAKLGSWHEYSVDLSAYAGEKFIAIRHFNCNDQYIMCVDDITANNITFSDEGGGGGGGATGTGTTVTIDFETGDFSQAEFVNDETYPWTVVTPEYEGYNGHFAIMSGNAGVSSSSSSISVSMEYAEDGTVSFLGGCWGEGSKGPKTVWDKCQFFIDGAQKMSYGAVDAWQTYSFPVTYGTHTFTWTYSKDGSVNPTGDCFFVDDITFVGVNDGQGGIPFINDPWEPDYDAPLGVIDMLYPQHTQQNVSSPLTLRWTNAENAAQYKVEFGSVYGNLETIVELSDVEGWNGILALAGLGITIQPNSRYYWKVYNYNNTGETEAFVLFTSEFNTPTNVRVTETEIFTDETTLLKWNIVGGEISELPETIIGEATNTNGYLPTYNLYNYSLTQQIYTVEEIGNAGIINSISFYPAGTITRNLDIYMVNTDKTSFSGNTDWITVTADDLVFSGNVTMNTNTWTTINLTTPFTFDGTNLAIVVDDNSGEWTSTVYYNVFDAGSQAIRIYSDDTNYDPTNPGSYNGTVMNVKNQIAINYGAKGTRDLLGCNIYVDSVLWNDEPIVEREYVLENLPYNMEGHSISVTGVFDYGESSYSAPATVFVSGYGNVTGTVKDLITETPLADAEVRFDGKDEFNNTVHYTTTSDANGEYTINNIKTGTYTAKASVEGYDIAMVEDVAVANEETLTLDLYLHEFFTPIGTVIAEEGTAGNARVANVTWSFGETPGGGGGFGDTFTEGFEGGLSEGWNVIDANNDGYTWCLTSAIPATWTYYASMTLDWYRTGSNAICSGSYINGVGALTPDEYLVTPQVALAAGSTFSFWAAATDASYPADHFGVFVSEDGTSNWTSVQEWTLTAKTSNRDGDRASRDGNGAKLGTWYQYSVDLSAYAGQKYIAIRHFNCNDQYIMCVDDIELAAANKRNNATFAAAGKGFGLANNAFPEDGNWYYYDNGVNEDAIGTGGGNFWWGIMLPAGSFEGNIVTKVSAYDYMAMSGTASIYQGGTSSPAGEALGQVNVTFTGSENFVEFTFAEPVSIDPEQNVWVVFYNGSAASYPAAVCSNTGSANGRWVSLDGSTWADLASYGLDYTFMVRAYIDDDGSGSGGGGGGTSGGGGSQLEATEHYFMIYRKIVFQQEMPEDEEELTVLLADEYAIGFSDTTYVDTEYADLPMGTYQYGVAAVYPWIQRNDNNVTEITWSNNLDKDMVTPLTINVVNPIAEPTGTVITLTNLNEQVSFTAEADETGVVTFDNFRKGDYNLTVVLDGYIAVIDEVYVPEEGLEMNLWGENPVINVLLEEYFAPVTGLVVSQTGFARWDDLLPQERLAQRYHVLCNNIFQGDTEHNYMILNTDNLVEGQTYTCEVAVIYTTGMSEFVSADFTYMTCDNVSTQVEELDGSVDLADVTLTWNGGTGGGGGGGGGGGTGSTFTEGFESGLPTGWNVIDANSDGYTWCLTSAIPSTWTYYATMSLDWYRTGTNAICSGSYINGVGALTPDEYLVSPQVTLASGSTFSFWAAACDASYPADHFGVFVSDNGTSGWTSVQEWTLTGKSGGNDGGRASRDGEGAKLGTWYHYTVDLSNFAGNKYIAIRHFNCNDQYIMCVDDLELSAGKGDNTFMAAGHGYGLANNSLTDDGNWYYYDNGVNEDAIGTGGGNFWWGIMLPAGTYQGNSVTKVAGFDYMAMSGTASIYQGGSTAPAGSPLGQVNVTFTGSTDFVEFPFANPVTIDPTQNVWVVFYNASGASYPAAVCANTGDANGRWVSLDGATWEDLAGYGLSYTFMIRAYIEGGGGGGGGTTSSSLTPNAYNIFMDGEFIGATTGTDFTWTAEDALEHEYTVVWVDQNYNVSCAASIVIAADPLNVGQFDLVSAIYPNPTNNDLHINTTANMKSIHIVNMLGQMVYTKEVEGTETILNMAQFGNGIYMVNIVTENGSSVHRIIVSK
jgi:hypothetical protein